MPNVSLILENRYIIRSFLNLWSALPLFSGLVPILHLLPRVFLYNIGPPPVWYSYFSVRTHLRDLITTCSPVLLSARPNHLSLAAILVSLMFARPDLALLCLS